MKRAKGLWAGLLVGLLVGCGDTAVPPTLPAPTPILPHSTAMQPPTETAVPPADPAQTATPAPTPIPDTGWQTTQPGLELRAIHLYNDAGTARERVTFLRLDPAEFTFRIAYKPG
ncbi:MAG: hypothetical protein KBA85_06470, partial [Chloroflexi bacterium]|nr:hypothetical protein [Chloroflexota bacterium]